MNNSDVIWVNLKVLAKLQPFQKLNTRRTHFQLQNPSSVYIPDFLYRWWVGSNRESDFNRLKELYIAAAKILKTDERERMKSHLRESLKGLESLQKTYENDATTKAKIDWLMDSVKESMKENEIVSTDDINVFEN